MLYSQYLHTGAAFPCFLSLLLTVLFGLSCMAEIMPHGHTGKLPALLLWLRLCDYILLIKYGWVWHASFQAWPLKFHQIFSVLLLPECRASSRESCSRLKESLNPWLIKWSSHTHRPTCIGLGMRETYYFIILSSWDLGITIAASVTYF